MRPASLTTFLLPLVTSTAALSCGQGHSHSTKWLPLLKDGRFHTGFGVIEWGHVGRDCVCEMWEDPNCREGGPIRITGIHHGTFGKVVRCYRCTQG